MALAGGGLLTALPLRAQVAAKLAPGIEASAQRAAPAQAVRVRVRDAQAFRQWAGRELPQLRLPAVTTAEVGVVLLITNVKASELKVLAASPLVEFVDVPDRRAHDERLLNQADLTVNSLLAVQRHYPALTG